MGGPLLPLIGLVMIAGKIYKVAKNPAAQALARQAIKKGAEKLNQLGMFSKPSGSLTREVVKNMRSRRGSETQKAPKSTTVKPPKLSGGTPKGQGRPRRGSTKGKPKVNTKAPKSGSSSNIKSGGGSGFNVGPKTKAVIAGGLGAAGILYAAGKKDQSPTIIKDGGSMPPSKGKKRLTVKSRSEATSSPPSRGKKRLTVKPKSAFKTFTVTDGSPNKIEIGKTDFNVPRSISAAKNRGSKYFYDKSGVKKLAVTAEDLKKSGKSLREWANTFAPKKQSKLDTTAFTRTIAARGS